jgi:hypothetical protein
LPLLPAANAERGHRLSASATWLFGVFSCQRLPAAAAAADQQNNYMHSFVLINTN